MTEPDRPAKNWWDELSDNAGLIGTALGVLGAVAYVLLSVLCTVVYAPLGVAPGDVGLGYGELLLRGGLGLAGVVLFEAALVSGTVVLTWLLPGKSADTWAVAAAVVLVSGAALWLGVPVLFVGLFWIAALLVFFIASGYAVDTGGSVPEAFGVGLLAIAPVLFVVVLISNAASDKRGFEEGQVPASLLPGLPPPWDAQVVQVNWADPPGPARPALPACLLNLGEADGTTVLYDATKGSQRTLRLPTSSLLIEVLPDEDSATPKKGESTECR